MKSPIKYVRAVMTRRILVNFRVRPEALQAVLPAPFRPKLINGWGLGGICLIKLQHLRPWFLPDFVGTSSENAAHRIAVEWTEAGVIQSGVFIPRRDTNSVVNLLAGGRLFPGAHHFARFQCAETEQQFQVALRSRDGETVVRIEAHLANEWPTGSVFASLEQASAFLKEGNCGWSPCEGGRHFEGVELRTERWEMQSLAVTHVQSSFFSDKPRFAPGSVEFDSALLMRGIPHTWNALESGNSIVSVQPSNRHRTRTFLEMP